MIKVPRPTTPKGRTRRLRPAGRAVANGYLSSPRLRVQMPTGPAALFVVATILLAGTPPTVPGLLGASGPAPEPRPTSPISPAASSVTNVSAPLHGPTGALVPGDRIGFRYELAAPGYLSAWGSLQVWFPATQVSFATAEGALVVPLGARNLTLSNDQFLPENSTEVLDILFNQTTFRPAGTAVFSTLGETPMSVLPFGTLTLALRWQWLLVSVDGGAQNSSWSTSTPDLEAAQYAAATSFGPKLVAPSGSLGACLAGPIGGRTFTLRAATLNPPSELNATTARAAPPPAADLCLQLNLPATAPLSGDLQLWENVSPNLSLLLLAMHYRVTNLTVAPTLSIDWTGVLNGGVLVGAVLLAVAVAMLMLGGRRPPRAGGRGSDPDPGAARATAGDEGEAAPAGLGVG